MGVCTRHSIMIMAVIYKLYLHIPGIVCFPYGCMEISRKSVFGWCYCHASFVEEETEAQGEEVTCPKSCWNRGELRFECRSG